MKSKVVNQLTEEELLDLLDQDEPTIPVDKYNDDFLNFLQYFNIVPGRNKITCALLYRLFKSWKKTQMDQKEFQGHLKLHFHKNQRNDFCFINFKSLDVNAKVLELLTPRKNPMASKTAKIHFDAFINFYKLEAGSNWIKLSELYKLYDYWQYTYKAKTRLGSKRFSSFCKLYLPHKIGAIKEVWHGISEKSTKKIKKVIKEKKGNEKK